MTIYLLIVYRLIMLEKTAASVHFLAKAKKNSHYLVGWNLILFGRRSFRFWLRAAFTGRGDGIGFE